MLFQPNCYIGTILSVWWLWWRVPLGSHVSRWALSHSPLDITPTNHPSCSSQASFFSALLTSSQALVSAELSGAIDRNWPALLQGIHNTIALSRPQCSRGETMPDSRDAFLSLWNPLCHLFLLFCLCFCALLSSYSIHVFIFSSAFKWRMSKMESSQMTTDLPRQCLCP